MARGFWMILAWVCALWYSTLTVYVAVKGLGDIKRMLAQLKSGKRPTG